MLRLSFGYTASKFQLGLFDPPLIVFSLRAASTTFVGFVGAACAAAKLAFVITCGGSGPDLKDLGTPRVCDVLMGALLGSISLLNHRSNAKSTVPTTVKYEKSGIRICISKTEIQRGASCKRSG